MGEVTLMGNGLKKEFIENIRLYVQASREVGKEGHLEIQLSKKKCGE